jgi:hypothetical protein
MLFLLQNTQCKWQYIQHCQSYYRGNPVKGLIEIPGSFCASINVGDIWQKRHEGYQRVRLQPEYEREDVSLAEKTDNGYQPDLGLVV